MEFYKNFEPVWADMDPNRHMRHTAYNDYAAQVRVAFLRENGYGLEKLDELKLGPVLFNEETTFLREIRLGDKLKVDVKISGLSTDGKFWNMEHHIYKNGKKLSAVIKVRGGWIDMTTRKLKNPPPDMYDKFDKLPKTADFSLIEKR
jgi:acyl-CoA thioester hydrolase